MIFVHLEGLKNCSSMPLNKDFHLRSLHVGRLKSQSSEKSIPSGVKFGPHIPTGFQMFPKLWQSSIAPPCRKPPSMCWSSRMEDPHSKFLCQEGYYIKRHFLIPWTCHIYIFNNYISYYLKLTFNIGRKIFVLPVFYVTNARNQLNSVMLFKIFHIEYPISSLFQK